MRTSVSDSTDFCGSAHHILALILANVLKGQLAWGKASDCKFAFDLEFGGGNRVQDGGFCFDGSGEAMFVASGSKWASVDAWRCCINLQTVKNTETSYHVVSCWKIHSGRRVLLCVHLRGLGAGSTSNAR